MPSSSPPSLRLIALITALAVSSLLVAFASLNKDGGYGRSLQLHTQAPNNVENYRQPLEVDSSNEPKSNLRVPVSKANQFLYYHSHSHNWSNQLVGLAHAAQIAYETNRILILPPIIEHHDRNVGVKGSPRCQHCLMPQVYEDAKLDAKKCADNEHVSFKEIMDLSQLSKSTGVRFVDLCEFVASEPTLAAEYFFQQHQRKSHPEIIDLDGKCTFGQTRSYPEMVNHFNSIFSDDNVALIPSAFATESLNSQSKAFLENVLAFHPSSDLMALQQLLLDHIGQPYASARSRRGDYADNHRFVCSDERKQVLLDWIQQENSSTPRKIGAKENTYLAFFASSSQEAAVCKQFFDDAGLQAFTLSDLLVEEDASQMLSSMKVSAEIVAPILDRLLVSLGNKVTLESPDQALAYVS